MSLAKDMVLQAISEERIIQDAKWGEQNHPDGTGENLTFLWGPASANLDMRTGAELAAHFKAACDGQFDVNAGNWRGILLEEVFEALAESDPVKLRTELLQVAAVVVAWVEAIHRRAS